MNYNKVLHFFSILNYVIFFCIATSTIVFKEFLSSADPILGILFLIYVVTILESIILIIVNWVIKTNWAKALKD